MAAVHRIALDASGEGMTLRHLPDVSGDEAGLIRGALADKIRHADQALDDGLEAVLHRLRATRQTTLTTKAAEVAFHEILGRIRSVVLHTLGPVGEAIGLTVKVGGWLESLAAADAKQAETVSTDAAIRAIKHAGRAQLDAVAKQVKFTPDAALWDLSGALDPSKTFFEAVDVARFTWLAVEAAVRPGLPVREQVDRLRDLHGHLDGLANDLEAIQ